MSDSLEKRFDWLANAITSRIIALEAARLSLEDRVSFLEEKIRDMKPRREP